MDGMGTTGSAATQAGVWLGDFDATLASGDTARVAGLFADVESIEAIFTFETSVGNGVVRLDSERRETRAWTLMTALDEIRGHEDPANGQRWQNVDWKRNFGGGN